jgi:hypothetical protein
MRVILSENSGLRTSPTSALCPTVVLYYGSLYLYFVVGTFPPLKVVCTIVTILRFCL